MNRMGPHLVCRETNKKKVKFENGVGPSGTEDKKNGKRKISVILGDLECC